MSRPAPLPCWLDADHPDGCLHIEDPKTGAECRVSVADGWVVVQVDSEHGWRSAGPLERARVVHAIAVAACLRELVPPGTVDDEP